MRPDPQSRTVSTTAAPNAQLHEPPCPGAAQLHATFQVALLIYPGSLQAAPGAAVPGISSRGPSCGRGIVPPFFLPRHSLAALVLAAFPAQGASGPVAPPAGTAAGGAAGVISRDAGGWRCAFSGGRRQPAGLRSGRVFLLSSWARSCGTGWRLVPGTGWCAALLSRVNPLAQLAPVTCSEESWMARPPCPDARFARFFGHERAACASEDYSGRGTAAITVQPTRCIAAHTPLG
jgi:hypothetical protein